MKVKSKDDSPAEYWSSVISPLSLPNRTSSSMLRNVVLKIPRSVKKALEGYLLL